MSGLARRVDVARLSAMNADSAGTCAASRQVCSWFAAGGGASAGYSISSWPRR